MESITALVACGAAFALSCYLGYGRAPSSLTALLFGAVSGIGFAVVFFVMTVAVAGTVPGIFDARALGRHLILLSVVAPFGAAAVALLAHRYAMSRVPF